MPFGQAPYTAFRVVGVVDLVKYDAARYDLPFGVFQKGGAGVNRITVKTFQSAVHHARICGTYKLFARVNPEEFLSKVAKLINEQKATMIVDHITYNVTDGKYDNDIFTANQIKTDLDKVFKANKAIQDYIFF